MSESLNKSVEEYMIVTNSLGLNDQERLRHLAVMLKDAARTFYVREVQPRATSFQEAINFIDIRFNDITNQHRIKRDLLSLDFATFLTKYSSPRTALEKLNEYIEEYFHRTPQEFQQPAMKLDILKQAVRTQAFANIPISNQNRNGLDYQSFLSELFHAIQHEIDAGRLQDNAEVTNAGNSEILWQQRLAGPQAQRQQQGRQSQQRGNQRPSLSRNYRPQFQNRQPVCWKCGQRGHKQADCRSNQRRDAVEIAVQLAQASDTSINEVLYSLADELNSVSFVTETPDENEVPDVEAFFGNQSQQPSSTSFQRGCPSSSGVSPYLLVLRSK